METVAKLASAEKEYRAARDLMDRPLSNPTSNSTAPGAGAGAAPPQAPAAAAHAKGKARAPGGGGGGGGGGFSEEELDSWHLDAVDPGHAPHGGPGGPRGGRHPRPAHRHRRVRPPTCRLDRALMRHFPVARSAALSSDRHRHGSGTAM